MNTGGFRAEEARRKSQERLAADRQRGVQALKDRDKAMVAEAAKTKRLRALRLAKEAADKESADRAATVKAGKTRTSPRSDGPADAKTSPDANA